MKSTHEIATSPTYEAGSCTIDAILVSPSLTNVTRFGWLPFGEGISDHRISFIDINSIIFLNRDRHNIIPIKAQRLQVNKKQSVKTYLRLIEHKYRKKEKRLLQRLNKLRYKTNGDKNDQRNQADRSDKNKHSTKRRTAMKKNICWTSSVLPN